MPSFDILSKKPAFSRQSVWDRLHGERKSLIGGSDEWGFRIHWHDFFTAADFPWSDAFRKDTLEYCLNLEGEAVFEGLREPIPAVSGIWYAGRDDLRAVRKAGMRHQFLTLQLNPTWLRQQLGPMLPDVHKEIGSYLRAEIAGGLLRYDRPQPPTLQMAKTLDTAGPMGRMRPFWMRGRLFDLLSLEMFPKEETSASVDRRERTSRQIASKTCAILAENLSDRRSLEEIARKVGCSPYHLSRVFSKEMGMTMSRYLRSLKMERARELLASGRFNVSETALEVGYSSLSHFSKTFAEHHGHCPCNLSLNKSMGSKTPQTSRNVKQAPAPRKA